MSNSSYTIHGGAWYDYQALARAAYRYGIPSVNSNAVVGFRVVEEHGIYVAHGGAWGLNAAYARAAFRHFVHPVARINYVGFRVVEEVKE